MKKILLLSLLILVTSNTFCQRLHYIKFIYEGDQTKPMGALIISVEKKITLTNELDKHFGHSIKTDINTFNWIRKLVGVSGYTTLYKLNSNYGGFKIVCSDGKIFYLYGLNVGRFSHQLQTMLKEKNADKRIIDIFNIY